MFRRLISYTTAIKVWIFWVKKNLGYAVIGRCPTSSSGFPLPPSIHHGLLLSNNLDPACVWPRVKWVCGSTQERRRRRRRGRRRRRELELLLLSLSTIPWGGGGREGQKRQRNGPSDKNVCSTHTHTWTHNSNPPRDRRCNRPLATPAPR